jgi:hypothetical protein
MKFISLKLYKPGVYIVFLLLLLSIPHEIFAQFIHKRPGSLDSYNMTLLPPYRKDASLLDSVLRHDFTVTMRDGVIIDCLKFMPITLPPAGGWPTVMMVHG